jgi:hypothetical protein
MFLAPRGLDGEASEVVNETPLVVSSGVGKGLNCFILIGWQSGPSTTIDDPAPTKVKILWSGSNCQI